MKGMKVATVSGYKIAVYAKAVVACLVAAGGALATALADGGLSMPEVITIVVTALAALGGVARISNAPGAISEVPHGPLQYLNDVPEDDGSVPADPGPVSADEPVDGPTGPLAEDSGPIADAPKS